MEPKKEQTEHEENGTKIERTTYNDPDTDTHVGARPKSGKHREPKFHAARLSTKCLSASMPPRRTGKYLGLAFPFGDRKCVQLITDELISVRHGFK
jgi:hypothetical protein